MKFFERAGGLLICEHVVHTVAELDWRVFIVYESIDAFCATTVVEGAGSVLQVSLR